MKGAARLPGCPPASPTKNAASCWKPRPVQGQSCLPARAHDSLLQVLALDDLDRTVVIAMVAVRVMQMAVDQIADVVTMRDRFVSATRAVDMAGFMAAATMLRGAAIRIGFRDSDHMLIYMVAMRMVQVAIMQVVDMAVVTDGGVAAARSVLVVVVLVMRQIAVAHGDTPGAEVEKRCPGPVVPASVTVFGFAGVMKHVHQQVADVIVGQRVKNMFCLPPPADQPGTVQLLQAG